MNREPPRLFPADLAQRWVRNYVHGDCHVLTEAISEALGHDVAYEVVALDEKGHPQSVLFHSCIRLSDGQLLDAGGPQSKESLAERYRIPGANLNEVPIAAIQMAFDEEEIVMALEVAARLPTLPVEIREAAWSHRLNRYPKVDLPWPVEDGPLDP